MLAQKYEFYVGVATKNLSHPSLNSLLGSFCHLDIKLIPIFELYVYYPLRNELHKKKMSCLTLHCEIGRGHINQKAQLT